MTEVLPRFPALTALDVGGNKIGCLGQADHSNGGLPFPHLHLALALLSSDNKIMSKNE